MPRIPTSKPQDVRSRPSIGGQVNINSQDGFFKSIAAASAEAGAAIEKAQIEKQQLIDAKEANEVAVFQNERKAELQKRLTEETDVTKHELIIDEWANNTLNLNLRPGVSNLAREKLQQNNNLFIQNARSSFIAQSTATAYKQARESAAVAAMTAIEERNEGALEASYDPSLFSPVERKNEIEKGKFKIRQNIETNNNNLLKTEKESLDYLILSSENLEDIAELEQRVESDIIYEQSEYGKRTKSLLLQSIKRKERSLVSRKESIIKDGIINQMNAVQNTVELNKLYENLKLDEYSQTLKSDLKVALDNRSREIITKNSQRISNEITLLTKRIKGIGLGEIESIEEAIAGIFDEEIQDFLKKSFSLGSGTRGINDPELLALEEKINTERAPFGLRRFDLKPEIVERVEDFVLDPNTSMEARFAATELLVARLAVDESSELEFHMRLKETKGPEGEITYEVSGWDKENIKVDDFQRRMIQSVAGSLQKIIGDVAVDKGDWTNAGLKPAQILQVYRDINNEEFLSQFKKSKELKTDNDLSKKIQEVFHDGDNGVISKHYKETVREKLSKLIFSKRKAARKPL